MLIGIDFLFRLLLNFIFMIQVNSHENIQLNILGNLLIIKAL